jgi:hypothetical protein
MIAGEFYQPYRVAPRAASKDGSQPVNMTWFTLDWAVLWHRIAGQFPARGEPDCPNPSRTIPVSTEGFAKAPAAAVAAAAHLLLAGARSGQ